jgi:hypothetical protein
VKINKAAPYSATQMDVWARNAANQLGYHPGEIATDPVKAKEVNELADELAGGRAARVAGSRAGEMAKAPIAAGPRATLTKQYQDQWNAIQTPVRNMETYLRIMEANYARYKAGDQAAWEPLRTAFVKVSEPNSVVMPSEFARSAGIDSLLGQMYGYVGKTLEGGAPLTSEIVDQMMDIARDTWEATRGYGAQQKTAIQAAIRDPTVNIPDVNIFGDETKRYQPPPPMSPLPQSSGQPKAAQPAAQPNAGGIPGGTGTVWDPKTGTFVR